MKDYPNGHRLTKKQNKTILIPLILLLLLTTMIAITATTTTTQTPSKTLQQTINPGNPTREGAPPPQSVAYWAKTYGGTGSDRAYSIQQTSDGGYIVAGYTSSSGAGLQDVWVLKLDFMGAVTWQKTYGGSGNDIANFAQQTSDGGYIVAGQTNSSGAGRYDVWVLKLDSTGSVTWQKTYGGSSDDIAWSVEQTSDRGYIVAGQTWSFGAGVGIGASNAWVLKLDSTGGVTWQKTYGGNVGNDAAQSVQQTTDGGYVVGGWTNSFTAGYADYWALKLDSTGGVTWQKHYGAGGSDVAFSVQQTSGGGYVIAGRTPAYNGVDFDFDFWVLKLDSTGGVIWQNTYGGTSGDEWAYSVKQTADGGYIVAGYALSFGAGGSDFWVLKLNSTGGVTWQNAYGGIGDDRAYSVQETADGGYIVAGYAASFGAGGEDVWIVKLKVDGDIVWDAGSGASTHITSVVPSGPWFSTANTYATVTSSTAAVADTTVTPQNTNATVKVQATPAIPSMPYWAKTYGGSDWDSAESVQQTSDGGYIVAGETWSFGADLGDVWVLKLDYTGGVTWQKTYGGPGYDYAYSVQQTADGGYVVAGYTDSFGADGYDFWVLKLDSMGGVTWQNIYGGTSDDDAYSVQQTSDGGYIVAGYTTSFGAGSSDFWVLKLDSSGGVTWQKAYGGTSDDYAYSVQQTSDGGYVVAGYTFSFGAFLGNAWVLKLDSTGGVTWQKTYGGNAVDVAYSVQQTSDGGYVVAGYTTSFGAGSSDFWVLKLDSSGGVTWQRTYGGTTDDDAKSVQQTSDGGYVVAGYTYSFGAGSGDFCDFWVLKLDSSGGVTWQRTYGGTDYDWPCSVRQTSDGGYVVAGYTTSFGVFCDFWVVKLGIAGDIVWDGGCGASTHITSVVPLSSSATILSPSVTLADTAATVVGTTATPHDTDCIVMVQSPDTIPPATITDLATSNPTTTSITLTWTAPGDSEMRGNATGYVVKYSTSGPITTLNWDSATTYAQLWTPAKNSTTETHSVTGLSPETQYWFAVEAYDTANNYGGVSNSPSGTTLLPPAPTIDQPSSITYTVGQTGNSVTWHPTSTIPDNYTISVNGGTPTSYSWDGSAITYNVDGLSVGTYIYNCTVYDTAGRKASSEVQVTVLPPAPTIDQPSPVTYTVGETGNSITWHPLSDIPEYYTISVDSGSPTSHEWDGSAIIYNIDGLSVGTHTYNCTVYDTASRKASSIVQVKVLPPAPTIDQPATITYTLGETGNTITWHPTSEIPDHYTISLDGASPTPQSWDGSDIVQSIDGLSVGTYTYNCTVYDTEGRTASSEVQVIVLPPAPTVDQPTAISYIIGQTGNSITWNPTSQIPDHYTISMNDGYPMADIWDGGSITKSVDGLPVGTYTFNCTVYDTLGRSASSKVTVTVLPPAPTIDQPATVTYTVGQTGNSITWHPTSTMPDHYAISVNGSTPTSHSWNGSAITYSVDGWSVGTYYVNCTAFDTQGRSASSKVTVTVHPSAPTLNKPSAVTYTAGTSGHSITWSASSKIPDHYTISVNGSSPKSYSWNGGNITYSIDDWSAGTYIVNCTVYDTLGRSASSTVTVTISERVAQGIPVTLIVGGVAVAAIVVVISIVIIKKRKK